MIAKKNPNLDIIIQDLPAVEAAFNTNIASTGLATQLRFHGHNFFEPQDITADVFIIKTVLHDWSDKYVIQIMQNLLPGLKNGTHILIFDIIVPPDYDENGKPSMPLSARRTIAAVDIHMHIMCNAKERKAEDWIEVIKRADPRFELVAIHTISGTPTGLLDFVFRE